jgi:quercetin dioxygenase-like cupin family protein
MRATSRKQLALASAGTTLALAAAGGTVALATAPSGETATPLARGALVKPANVNRKVTGGRVSVKTKGALDALMVQLTLAPGGNGGWHTHAGPHVTIIKQGTLTIIDAKCKRHDVSAGHAAISSGSTTEKTENKGTTPVTYDVTFVIPHGAASPRIDAPAPAGCTA